MGITPVELRGVKFKNVLRGFDPKEVKLYLSSAADELERLLLENKESTEKLEHYEKLEASIKEAAIQAQEATKIQRENAKKEAELIIEKAKVESQKLIESVRAEKNELGQELSNLKSQKENFLAQFKALLNSYLSLLERETAPKTASVTPSAPEES